MPESDDADAESLTTDRAFDLLGDGRRRRAVSVLRERDGAMELRDLAGAVVERGPHPADGPVTEPTENRRKRVAASLHHCHLPKLDDADVVEYDPAANLVEPTPVAEELEPFFEAVETRMDDIRCD